LRTEHIAAFGIDASEREELVIVAEVGSAPADPAEIRRRVRVAVADVHGVTAAVILTVPRGTIPKISSGKVRRGECGNHYRAGKFTIDGESGRR
ncbi:MAG: fatty acyl-AMP ligase, partial [Stackebrandtia sp.]